MIKGLILQFQHVGFQFDSAAAPLFDHLTLSFPAGWTGIVGPNGIGKSTLLALATAQLEPTTGHIISSGNAICSEQRTDSPPPEFQEFLEESWGEALDIQLQLGIEPDWADRWPSLSHGERKRAQVGTALWKAPAIWALDEPSNHLDASARAMLLSALRRFRGIGLLVSHDRELLDALCGQCLFFEAAGPVMRPGGITQAEAQSQLDAKTHATRTEQAAKTVRRLEQESQRRREKSEQAKAKNTKRGLDRHDADAKGRIDLGRLTGKDAVGGRERRQLEGRLNQVRAERDFLTVAPTYELGVWMDNAAYSHRSHIFRIPSGELPLGAGRSLQYPDWEMGPRDRIALTGENGSGKSTFLNWLLPRVNLPPERVIFVPQEISQEESRRILEDVFALSAADKGRLMTLVSRLGSRPHRLLSSELPSPGEVRKILLAQGLMKSPHLIAMDEPTNHMDLPSIHCLESVLKAAPCGILLVSHDRYFLNTVGITEWTIQSGVLARAPK